MPAKPLSFTSPDRPTEPTAFELDGETLYAIQPKAAALMKAVRGIDPNDDLAMANLVDEFSVLVLTPDTLARINERLEDPEDPFDLPVLEQIMTALQEEWTVRPTTLSSSSSKRPKRTGTASTVRRPRSA